MCIPSVDKKDNEIVHDDDDGDKQRRRARVSNKIDTLKQAKIV